jgi:hypothetical protein
MGDTKDVILDEIADILWPVGDADHEWGSDTIEFVAEAMERGGYKPPGKADRVSDMVSSFAQLAHTRFGTTLSAFTLREFADTFAQVCESEAERDHHTDYFVTLGVSSTYTPAATPTTPATHEAPRPPHQSVAYQPGTDSSKAPVPDLDWDPRELARRLLPYWMADGIRRLDVLFGGPDGVISSVQDPPKSPTHSWHFLRHLGPLLLADSPHGIEHIGLLLDTLHKQENADSDYALTAIADVLTHYLTTHLLSVSLTPDSFVDRLLGLSQSMDELRHEQGPDERTVED